MLYLRNDAIGTQAIADLCAVPGVKGVKWATPNPLKLAAAINACDPSIVWVGGLAEVWAPPFYAVGARGFTSGLINVWPERSMAIHAALEAADYAEANRLIARNGPVRRGPRRRAERHQRDRREGRAAGHGPRLRPDAPAVGLAADRSPAEETRCLPDRQRSGLSAKQRGTRIDPDVKRQLEAVSVATLATALYKRGLRNQVIQGVHPVAPKGRNMVGPAFTLRYMPAREDRNTLAVFRNPDHPQRKAIEECPEGAVMVMDSRKDARAASAGDILITRLMVRGGAGVVTDGGFRDAVDIGKLDIPSYHARPSSPTNLTLHEAIDINVPIGCGDVAVFPGDIVVGDDDCVIVIPAELAQEVAAEATEMTAYEDFVARTCPGRAHDHRPVSGDEGREPGAVQGVAAEERPLSQPFNK